MIVLHRERERLPDERKSVTWKFRVGPVGGFVTVGLYPDGRPGEVFIRIGKSSKLFVSVRDEADAAKIYSMLSGLLDAVAIGASLLLQYGVPLEVVARKHVGGRFEPSGPTGDPAAPFATSVLDCVFRRMLARFGSGAGDGAVGGTIEAAEAVLSGKEVAS